MPATSREEIAVYLLHCKRYSLAKTGTASVGGEFSLAKNGAVVFKKSFVAKHQWESSFIGAVAIPAAIDNYSTTVQKLLGELLSDPDFIASLR